jgi:hypothetical protein
MAARAEGTFQIRGWEETRYADMEAGRGLAEAAVTQDFAGDITGTGAVRWHMCYRSDGTADWVGMQQISGQIAGREGTFVLRTVGTFDGAKASGDWQVVVGSGTGEMAGLTGTGRIEAPMGQQATYSLDYDL